MSTFKLKPKKIRYTNNVHTLDELHKNEVNKFMNGKQKLQDKKNELDKLKYLLDILEKKKFDDNYNMEDTRAKCKLRNDIKHLEDEICDIENDSSEIEYYTKTSDIIVDYYDKINISSSSPDSAIEISDNKTSKKESNHINSISNVSNKNSIFVKHKNSTSRKKHVIPGQKNISFFFPSINKSNSTNTDSHDNSKSRANCLENYKFVMGYESKKKQSSIDSFVKLCPTCNVEKIIFITEGMLVCNVCGEVEPILVKNEKPSYKENTQDKPDYPYKRINHFTEWLTQFQGKESTDIPKEIYDQIYNELHKNKIYDFNKITISYMRQILKNLSLTGYYEHAIYILSKISKKQSPIINMETEEKLKHMFSLIQLPFEKHRPKDRINFLSYSYVLHKFCQLLELDNFIKCFPLLKSREKLRSQDKIWEAICKELRWEFISSV
jgi:hypothetical protein